jgi:hypothetical protein
VREHDGGLGGRHAGRGERATEQRSGEGIGRVGHSSEHDRRGVAEATLDLARSTIRVHRDDALGGLPHDQLAGITDSHDRRHRGTTATQLDHAGRGVVDDCRGSPGGAQIDGQTVGARCVHSTYGTRCGQVP